MTRASFHRLSVDLPDGWRDESLVVLLGPEPRASPGRRGGQGLPARVNLVIRRAEADPGVLPLGVLADLQGRAMAELAPGTRVVGGETLALDDGTTRIPVVTREYLVDEGPRLVLQLHAYVRVGTELWVAVGSGLAGPDFAATRERLLGIVRSLRFE